MTDNALMKDDVFRPNTHISADVLKILAMVIMLTDHIGAFLLDRVDPLYIPLRSIGRLAFPIFCFLMAEGAFHTRSMPKYLARLALFAFLSSPPYNLVHGSPWYSTENVNIFFTLFLGLLGICAVSRIPKAIFSALGKKNLAESGLACTLLGMPFCLLCCGAASLMDTDYGEYGVAAIVILWLLRKQPGAAWCGFTALTALYFSFLILGPDKTGVMRYDTVSFEHVFTKFLSVPEAKLVFYPQIQMLACFAFFPCMLYNGRRSGSGGTDGKPSGAGKYLFYAFYPVHLWCLWLAQLYMNR